MGAARAAAEVGTSALSHNLQGQRLGRKGRDTRERIIAAAERLLADPSGAPLSLSAVARDASLAMTTLYLYFTDLTELLLAILERIMESADQAYLAQVREHWPDETLGEHCLAFVHAFHRFWLEHSRILHLRNSYPASPDPRMMRHRVAAGRPLIELMLRQMGVAADTPAAAMASTLVTGAERVVTVTTDLDIVRAVDDHIRGRGVEDTLRAQARLMELGIRDTRAGAGAAG